MTSKNEEEGSTDNNSSLIEAIGSSTVGIQSTFSSMYNTLEKSLQQNVQMTQSMLHMIDEMFKANLKIASTLAPMGNGKIKLSLLISNRTKLPTIALTGLIHLEDNDDKIDIIYRDAYNGQTDCQLPNIFESPCNILPETQYKQDIELHLKQLTQCSGYILISVPNPLGQQRAIEIKHSFGLYLIDQFVKEISDEEANLEVVDEEGSYSIAFIRKILEIHPMKGIDVNMHIKLSSPNVQIFCKIMRISDDFNTLCIQFSSNNKEIACKLIAELKILSGLF